MFLIKNIGERVGERQVWPGNGMKLMDRAGMKPCIRFCGGKCLWVNRAGEMELGRGQRNGMNRATLAVRNNPAYELNELIRATGPGEVTNGERER